MISLSSAELGILNIFFVLSSMMIDKCLLMIQANSLQMLKNFSIPINTIYVLPVMSQCFYPTFVTGIASKANFIFIRVIFYIYWKVILIFLHC